MVEVVDPVRAIAEVLTEHGPLPEEDIGGHLVDAGVADPDDLIDDLLDEFSCPAAQLADGRWVWLPALLAGRVVTHRLTADEAAHDLLTVTPDLDPITALCDHDGYRQLADGSPVQLVLADFDHEVLAERGIPDDVPDRGGALLLAPGTLAGLGLAAGDLVGVRLTEAGLVVEAVSTVANSAVGDALAATLVTDAPTYFDAAVWTVCAADRQLFTEPLPPLSEIVDGCGLARDGEWLAVGGFDFDRWRFGLGCAGLAARHELDSDDAFALYTLVQLYEHLALQDTEDSEDTAELEESVELVAGLGIVLADPVLAQVLLTETVGFDPGGAEALGRFAELLEPRVPRHARVGLRWLRAVALQRRGEIDAAERELLAAESMNPDWPWVLVDLARIASDRGDAEGGLALLNRAGVGADHPLVELLERHRPEARRDLGRNEPCWCGSGRKYKKCHLGHEQLPLSERLAWLYTKAMDHALLTGWRPLLAEVGYERGRYDDDDDFDPLFTALSDPLVLDAVLFEGGAFAEFLRMRGTLLPEDERLLAEQWVLAQRSVFDVEQVRPGQGVTVRDVRTGDVHEVVEATASRTLQPGQLICARVVPAGDTVQFFGGIEPVALHQRGPLIELLDSGPDPVTLVAYLSRRFAPPTLTNTEGDPLALCEASVRISDPAGIEAALDDTYHRIAGEQPPRWLEHVTTHGMERVRATLVLDGDTLRVETNSEERMDRVLDTLADLDPAMDVLDDTREPIPDARVAAELAKRLPAGGGDALDPADPDMAAVLDEFIRAYEEKWLDEAIPALDGCTPRQAADDPTRRGDLIKLLDSFPAAATGGMSVDRLRDALGLR